MNAEVDTRKQLLDVAETLFLQHGLDGVSLRTIVRESGQKNQSALQYYFGGRDGLIAAILTRRAEQLEKRRRELLDDALNAEIRLDLNAICGILVEAPFTLCRDQPAFRNFLGQFGQRLLASDQDLTWATNTEGPPTRQDLRAMMASSLSHLESEVLALRLENTNAFGLLVLSRHARRKESFRGRKAGLFFNNLVDQVAGMLVAPVSAGTQERLNLRKDKTG